MTPPMQVAVRSSQSHFPPHILSLNSIPTPKPNTNKNVSKKAQGMAKIKCFNRFDLVIQLILILSYFVNFVKLSLS